MRRDRMLERKHEMVARDMEEEQQAMPDLDSALDDDIGDELLRLIFTACHPRLSREARAALTLRMICGLTTEEIARAFLLPDATIAQRIVRAKRTLSEKQVPFEAPRGDELALVVRDTLRSGRDLHPSIVVVGRARSPTSPYTRCPTAGPVIR